MSASLYGLVAEFRQPEEILAAAARVREAGYRAVEAYSPFPVHGLDEAIGFEDNRLPWMIFIGGIVGLIAGYSLEWGTNSPMVERIMSRIPADVVMRQMAYPMNIGGKPFHSWPAFIPIAFETTILFAAGTAAVGMLLLNGLPRPYHSIFNAQNFERASQDRFFLCIEATDPKFNYENTWEFLKSLGPDAVSECDR